MAQFHQPHIRNRLLTFLSPDDFALVEPHLEAVTFELRQHLFRAEHKISHVTFPERGRCGRAVDAEHDSCSHQTLRSDHTNLEPPFLRVGDDCMVQAAGEAFRIGAGELQVAMDRSHTLRAVLLRFVQISQTAYANAGYSTEERLARWLLMTHDRLGGRRHAHNA